MSDTLFDASGRVNSSKWAVGDEKTVGDVGEWHFFNNNKIVETRPSSSG